MCRNRTIGGKGSATHGRQQGNVKNNDRKGGSGMSSKPSLRDLEQAMRDCKEAIKEAIEMEGIAVAITTIEDFLKSECGEEALEAFRISIGNVKI